MKIHKGLLRNPPREYERNALKWRKFGWFNTRLKSFKISEMLPDPVFSFKSAKIRPISSFNISCESVYINRRSMADIRFAIKRQKYLKSICLKLLRPWGNELEQLGGALATLRKLQHFELVIHGLRGENQVASAIRGLKKTRQLKSVHIKLVSFNANVLGSISEVLMKNKKIESLRLSLRNGNTRHIDQWITMFHCLSHLKFLKNLEISLGKSPPIRVLPNLVASLESTPKLSHMKLEIRAFNATRLGPIQHLIGELESHTNLRELQLSLPYGTIKETDLIKALNGLSALENLNSLAINLLGIDVVTKRTYLTLAAALQHLSCLTSFFLKTTTVSCLSSIVKAFSFSKRLKKLHLESKDWDAQDHDLYVVPTNFKMLPVSGFKIDTMQYNSLSAACITKMLGNLNYSLKKINISLRSMSQHSDTIVTSLAQSLQKLNLSAFIYRDRSKVSEAVVGNLFQSLMSQGSLEKLKICCPYANGINNENLECLAKVINKNNRLRVLELSLGKCSKISFSGVTKLRMAIMALKFLNKLTLIVRVSRCNFRVTEIGLIRRSLSRHKTLIKSTIGLGFISETNSNTYLILVILIPLLISLFIKLVYTYLRSKF